MKALFLLTLVSVTIALSPQTARAQWTTILSNHGADDFATSDSDLYVTDGRIFRSSDLGETWYDADYGMVGAGSYRLFVYGEKLYSNVRDNGVVVSTDKGLTWKACGKIFDGTCRVTDFLERDSYLFATTSFGIIGRSRDSGSSWEKLQYMPEFVEIGCIDSNSRYSFVGTWWGEKVLRSNDDFETWENVAPPGKSSVFSILATESMLLAGTFTKGIWKSTDDGNNWSEANEGLSGERSQRVFALESTPVGLFAAILDGVYWSNDQGNSWKKVLDDETGSARSLLAHKGYLFAGTTGAVFRRPLSDFLSLSVGKKEATSHPSIVYDPLFRSVYIESEELFTVVTVTDLLGRTLATLAPERKGITVSADLPRLPSGVYIVRFVGQESVALKILL